MRRSIAPQRWLPLFCAALSALAPMRAEAQRRPAQRPDNRGYITISRDQTPDPVNDVARAEGATPNAPRPQGTTVPVVAIAPVEQQADAEPRAEGDAPAEGGTRTPRSRLIARESAETLVSDTSDEAGFLSVAPLQVAGARGRRYTGRRVDIDLRDADIHNVLRLLAEVGSVNIVASQDVEGSVTIRMRNVPWDQALDVILAARGLGMQRNGNIIRVAPQTVLDRERELLIERQRQLATLEPLETRLMPVSYALASELAPRAREMLSARGSVSVDERTNVMIVRDTAAVLNQIERLIRSLDTQTPQVLIEARIVEATSTFSRDIGIQWGGDINFGQGFGNPTGLAFPSSIGVAGGATDMMTMSQGLSPTTLNIPNPNFAVNLPATVGSGSGGALGFTFGSVNGNFNLNVRLTAAEVNNQLRIVSAPRILTLDNREALIAQGTLIPYSQVSAQGVQTAFQEAKLQLRVRPHVTADGSVSMHVRITRDEPDFNRTSTRGDPTILKKEAETDLLVPDGRTAVIGGIFTRTTGRSTNQVPGLGDIPILGALFSRRRSTDDRGEMIIFLTPRIVNRAEAIGR